VKELDEGQDLVGDRARCGNQVYPGSARRCSSATPALARWVTALSSTVTGRAIRSMHADGGDRVVAASARARTSHVVGNGTIDRGEPVGRRGGTVQVGVVDSAVLPD
jgi:hypothetical protein